MILRGACQKCLSVFLLGMESYSSLLTSDLENEKKDREGFITLTPFFLALSHCRVAPSQIHALTGLEHQAL